MRGMAPATERMRLVEAWKLQAETSPRWYLWCNAIAGPILLVGMIFYIAVTRSAMIVFLSVISLSKSSVGLSGCYSSRHPGTIRGARRRGSLTIAQMALRQLSPTTPRRQRIIQRRDVLKARIDAKH